jgi:hypothetical protein
VGVAAFFPLREPKIQPSTDLFGLGVASAGFSALGCAAASAGFVAVDGFVSGFFSPVVVETAAMRVSAVDTSWAQTSVTQALAATAVVRMEKGFGMIG